MRHLDEAIRDLEDRVVNAKTLEASAALHDRLDALRARRDESEVPDPIALKALSEEMRIVYERGYQAGYHAGKRRTEA